LVLELLNSIKRSLNYYEKYINVIFKRVMLTDVLGALVKNVKNGNYIVVIEFKIM